MILLAFSFEKDATGPQGPNPDLWPDECKLGAFEGFQNLEIDGIEFSGPLPILGFARFLKFTAQNFLSSELAEYEYNDLSSSWVLNFRLIDKNVEVSDSRGSGKACMDKESFIDEVSRYVQHVYDECCELSPELKQHEFIQESSLS